MELFMNTTQNISAQPRLIALAKLQKSALNVRRTKPTAGMEELKASLLAHGLMQNLVVTDSGGDDYHVIAGGRRLEALKSLQAEGKLPEDFAVPCQVVTEERAREMSLAENTVRLAMHPADQFEAFAALIDQGDSAGDVARRFGIDESLVLKRMKLARVAPQLVKLYREDGMTLECLMAFTVTDDHRRQMKVFKSLTDWQKDDPSAIRAALTEKFVEASSKLALFVGVDAYVAAGGSTRADLFGDEVYLEKPFLLNRLAEEKLAAIRSELEAEGWSWIEINPERDWESIHRCGRLSPRLIDAPAELLDRHEEAKSALAAVQEEDDFENDDSAPEVKAAQQRLEQIEEQLAAYVGFEPEHKELAGCFVSIGQDGAPFIDKGLVKPEQRKQLARLLRADGSDGDTGRVKPKHALPESLRRDLAAYRTQVAQVEIAGHPVIALELLAFRVAGATLGLEDAGDGPDVTLKRPRPQSRTPLESSPAARELEAIERSLDSGWAKRESELDRFETFRALPDAQKLQWLAYGVALSLRPKLAPSEGEDVTAYDAALAFTEGNVAAYWRPAKDSFLARINREQLLALGRATLGETWAQTRSSAKKATLVDQLDRAFGDPAKYGRKPEQAEVLKSWLPAGMAFSVPEAPKPAKARKARKAA
jgi:ParB family transcriptional regulator, chromosome partitioning protein